MPIHNSRDVYIDAIKTICTQADIRTIVKRSSDLNFLTKELPALGKAVDYSLSTGFLNFSECRFKPKKGTQLPLLFHDLFEKVYNNDGSLRYTLCSESLRLLRLSCYMCYKLEVEFSEETNRQSYAKFLLTDQNVKNDFTHSQLDALRPFVNSVMPNVMDSLVPNHGNGAVCERLNHYGKRSFRAFPRADFLIPSAWDYQNLDHAMEHKNSMRYEGLVARYINVPKDSRGPRGIALQPTRLMSYQKALMKILYEYIEEASPAKGLINFTDQTINQELARKASMTEAYCTIDLKDASDLVSWNLVKQVVSEEWADLLTATRCTHIEIDDKIIPLNKFASMGSALCFPIEAICFWAICRTVSNEVYVYGDDIIVPNQDYDVVVNALSSYGLIVNADKSLHNGKFRESCGGEYYFGNNITPLRLKRVDPQSIIAFANNLVEAGLLEAADNIVSSLEYKTGQIYCRGKIGDRARPFVFNNGRLSSNHVFFKRRYVTDFQRYEYRIPSLVNSNINEPANLSEYDKYYEWMRSAQLKVEQRAGDWYGVQAAQVLESRAGYKWVEL